MAFVMCLTVTAVIVSTIPSPHKRDFFWLILLQTTLFSAWPIETWWEAGKRNMNYGASITAFAAIGLGLDLVILGLPLPVITGLQLSYRRKVELLVVFWLGAL